MYLSANKTIYAKFCTGESQLRSFLLGMFNEERAGKREFVFDEERCSPGCLEVLVTYGLETDGHSISGGLRYDTVKHTFQ